MNEKQCAMQVQRGCRVGQCERVATVTEDGKRYCKQHAPSLGETRLVAKNARWDAEAEKKGREVRMARAAPALLEACRKALTCASIDSSVRQVIVEAIAAAEGKEGGT